jgi:hypothetical protein
MGLVLMRLLDGTILMHGSTPYDPVKAHEYYLRTRKLKGRQGSLGTAPARPRPSRSRSTGFVVKLPNGKTTTMSARELTEQKAYAAKRVQEIKVKLAELSSKLKKAMSEARKKDAKSTREAKKPETAAEKSEKAREAKQYREKNQTKLATKRRAAAKTPEAKEKAAKEGAVAKLEGQIEDIQKRLKAAVSIQRALAGAVKRT